MIINIKIKKDLFMNFTKKVIVSFSVVTALVLSASAATNNAESKKVEVSQTKSILDAYCDIALANYSDTLKDAKNLKAFY
jgi:putative iron-regulated protein